MTDLAQLNFTKDQLQGLVETILKEAKSLGATSSEVDIGVNKGFNISVRNGDVETVEYNQDKGIGVSVYFGKSSGSASLSDIRPEAIKASVKAACDIAKFTDEDEFAGLAPKELLAFDYPEINVAYPWDMTVEKAIELAKDLEAKALVIDKKLSTEGVEVSTTEAYHAYGNSEGFYGIVPATRHELSCVLIAKENDQMQRDYSYTVSCDPSMLESVGYIANEAAERTLSRLNARSIKTQNAPVIFVADEAKSLIGHFIAAISGGNLYRKSSFLLDQLNTQVFPEHITIEEKPYLDKYLGSSPYDDNGVRTRNNIFIKNGILNSYALGVYSARKLGMQTTGNAGGVHNLFISTGLNDLNGLIKKMHKGLLVTELMGQGVNIINGDYSRGCSGFWVENGEIQYPVQEITIAGNLKDIYSNLVEVGTDVDKRSNVQTGSILLDNMMIAGS